MPRLKCIDSALIDTTENKYVTYKKSSLKQHLRKSIHAESTLTDLHKISKTILAALPGRDS